MMKIINGVQLRTHSRTVAYSYVYFCGFVVSGPVRERNSAYSLAYCFFAKILRTVPGLFHQGRAFHKAPGLFHQGRVQLRTEYAEN